MTPEEFKEALKTAFWMGYKTKDLGLNKAKAEQIVKDMFK
jgi:hypothetical protein